MIPPEEPVFVLRAQDELAVKAIEFWAEELEKQDGRSGKVAGARMVADEFRGWPIKKKPD